MADTSNGKLPMISILSGSEEIPLPVNTISATTQIYGGMTPAFKPGVNLSVMYFSNKPEKKYLELYEISTLKAELETKHGMQLTH